MATSGKIELSVRGLTFEAPTADRAVARALKVGDRVKVLTKKYDDSYQSHPGVIVAIDAFQALPTIVVMYAEYSYGSAPELKFLNFNEKSKDVELMRMSEEEAIVGSREEALEQFQRAETDLLQKLEALRERREFFTRRFGVAFGTVARDLRDPAVPKELVVAEATS